MATVERPDKFPLWATNGDNIEEPDNSGEGWLVGEEPASTYFNWLMHYYGWWIEFLNQQEINHESRIVVVENRSIANDTRSKENETRSIANETRSKNNELAISNYQDYDTITQANKDLSTSNKNRLDDLSTDEVENKSGVTGDTLTEALDELATQGGDTGGLAAENKQRLDDLKASQVADDSAVGGTTVKDSLDLLNSAIGGVAMPLASVIQNAGVLATATGWYVCNGQELSTTEFAGLYAAIGGTYNNALDASGTPWPNPTPGTFRVPDMRDRVGVGAGSAYTAGDGGGEKNHTLIPLEMPAHSHFYEKSNNHSDIDTAPSGVTVADDSDTTTATEETGGNEAHNNLQPYLAMSFYIKAK